MVFAIVISMTASVLLFGSGFFNLFTPLPFSSLFVRRGLLPVFVAILLAMTFLSLFYFLSKGSWFFLPGMVLYPYLGLSQVGSLAVLSFFYYAWIGFALVWVGRKKLSWEKGIGQIILSTIVVTVVSFFVLSHFVSLFDKMKGSLDFILQRFFELNPQMTPEEKAFLTGPFLETLWRLLPAIWINMTLVVVASNLLLIRRWVSNLLFSSWGEFPAWRLDEKWIWAPISLGIFYLGSQFLEILSPFSWILLNLLLVTAAAYFFQGLSIFIFFLRKWLSPLLRMAVLFLMIAFFQPLGLFLIFVGLFDFWFDFRKLKRVGGPHASHS
ncbi:MAG: DUF2232 domain-containing protein [Deltaproteobacteria bacterium]|nr:DUF2232 domain-containing protein [Deltaproteobacteria bacterium]